MSMPLRRTLLIEQHWTRSLGRLWRNRLNSHHYLTRSCRLVLRSRQNTIGSSSEWDMRPRTGFATTGIINFWNTAGIAHAAPLCAIREIDAHLRSTIYTIFVAHEASAFVGFRFL